MHRSIGRPLSDLAGRGLLIPFFEMFLSAAAGLPSNDGGLWRRENQSGR
jgi:hypothetical protein